MHILFAKGEHRQVASWFVIPHFLVLPTRKHLLCRYKQLKTSPVSVAHNYGYRACTEITLDPVSGWRKQLHSVTFNTKSTKNLSKCVSLQWLVHNTIHCRIVTWTCLCFQAGPQGERSSFSFCLCKCIWVRPASRLNTTTADLPSLTHWAWYSCTAGASLV